MSEKHHRCDARADRYSKRAVGTSSTVPGGPISGRHPSPRHPTQRTPSTPRFSDNSRAIRRGLRSPPRLRPERPPASTLPRSAGCSHSTGPRGPRAALPLRSTSRSPAAPDEAADEAASVFALQARSAARAPGPSNTRLPHRHSPRWLDSSPSSARKPGTRGTVSGSVITEFMCRRPWHRGHFKTSSPKTRFKRSAQRMYAEPFEPKDSSLGP